MDIQIRVLKGWLWLADKKKVLQPGQTPQSAKDERRLKRLELRVTLEDLMESPTFKRFNAAIDNILETAEDADLTELQLGQ